MKKAVIVGGSNGIGLAIARKLIAKGYHACILDRVEPDGKVLDNPETFTYYPCDLLDFQEAQFQTLTADEDVCALMITAGFGRVAQFEYLHPAEIENLLKVNTVAAIKILRYFYERIKSAEPFYCGFMGSIAGWCSSPLFSVYAASKAALCRFAESVNIELEAAGCPNRILDVSPGSIKGTRFNGGENNMALTEELAGQIVDRLLRSETLYIPQYEEIYKGVLDRYQADPHGYGIHSYEYKKASGRVANEKRVCIGYLSGTFDLFHVGHLNLLRRAKAQCDYLIVGVHPDASHKGKVTFIPFEERMAVVGGIRYVDKVVESCHEDSDAWDRWHFDKLFVGSDYKGSERFAHYEAFFAGKGVEIVYFPYTKSTSSTQIRQTIIDKNAQTEKE